jgi:hypothetical protein
VLHYYISCSIKCGFVFGCDSSDYYFLSALLRCVLCNHLYFFISPRTNYVCLCTAFV